MTFLAGQVLTPDDLNELIPLRASKASATSRASTTTIADDPDLTLTLEADTLYHWRAVMRISGNGGDFKCAWTVPSGSSSVQRTTTGPDAGTTDVANTNVRVTSGHASGTEITYGTTSSNGLAVEEGLLLTGGSAGAMTLQWAQGSTNVNATSLGQGSFFTAQKVLSS